MATQTKQRTEEDLRDDRKHRRRPRRAATPGSSPRGGAGHRQTQGQAVAYRIYIDRVTSTARIHEESCTFYKRRKRRARQDNFWDRPFPHVDDAFKSALEKVEMAITAKCCLDHLKITRTR